MDEDWRKILYQRFSIFSGCNDGWSSLVVQLIREFDALEVPYTILQIKEKWGGLRVYFNLITPQNDQIWSQFNDIVDKIEHESYTICEYCGLNATACKRWNGYWYKSLCDSCGQRGKGPSCLKLA